MSPLNGVSTIKPYFTACTNFGYPGR